MFQKCILLTLFLFMAEAVYILSECSLCVRYLPLIWHEHGRALICYAGILFFDITCILYLVGRYFLLQETGRKLAHYEKQLATGQSVTDELSKLVQQGRR